MLAQSQTKHPQIHYFTMNVSTHGDGNPVRNLTTTNEPLKKRDHSISSNLTTSSMSLQEIASFGSLNCDYSSETEEDWNGTHRRSSESHKPRSSTKMLNKLLDRVYIEPDQLAGHPYGTTLDEETHAILEQVLFDFSNTSTTGFLDSYHSEDNEHSSSTFSIFGNDSICLTKCRQLEKEDSEAQMHVK